MHGIDREPDIAAELVAEEPFDAERQVVGQRDLVHELALGEHAGFLGTLQGILGGFGQLGDDTGDGRSSPGEVLGVSDAVRVTAGRFDTLVSTADGSVWAWGSGRLGDGTTLTSREPRSISEPGLNADGAGAIDERK